MAITASSVQLPLPPDWRIPFEPLFQDPHWQTIVGRYWPAPFDDKTWPTEERYFRTEPNVQVLAHCNSAGAGADDSRPIVLAVHGLTASSQAPYMRTLAQRSLKAGFDVIRLNVRNCGGTEHLAPTLYHSGLTCDLRAVVEQLAPRPLFLAGFSMGGNMVLKLAGEWGDEPPPHVRGVCGISAPVRLAVCARRLGERRNRVYETRFLRELRWTLLRKRRAMPEALSEFHCDRVRSIYEFDDTITAPAFGFASADDYYERASSAGFLEKIRVPALLIQAQDDPFIPFEVFADIRLENNLNLHLEAPRHGGHVAFLANQAPRFWAIEQTLSFFEALQTER